jgi:lantibiotic modifying enzyme
MKVLLDQPAISKKILFKDIPLEFPDVFRGQYFIESLEKESKHLISFLNTRQFTSSPLEILLKPFFSSFAKEIDQIILPVISHEVAIARDIDALSGVDGKARYENFFVNESGYTNRARSIPLRYPLLFKMMDTVIQSTLKSALDCLVHLMHDLSLLKENFFIEKNDFLEFLDILGKSDPHLGHRTFLLRFQSGKRVIHKSVDLSADQLYGEFLQTLELPFPYNLKNMRVIPKGHEYGWIEYIAYHECNSIQQIKNFYRRAGVLVAVADCLNYTDGHFENLIAAGEYPILLDGETLFQNYSIPERKEYQKKNLLATSLVQKPPSGEMEMGYASAFQAPPINHFEVVYPFVLKDQTDEIELHYRGLKDDASHNCPAIGEKYFTIHNFIEDLIEGFSFAFDHIKKQVPRILSDTEWWKQVAKVKSRTVLRETMAYCYLLRRIQRPEACISEATMRNILEAKLGNTFYTNYEIEDLMRVNIPYFYQYPGEKYLYQGDGKKHSYLFLKSGIEVLKEQFLNWNEAYKIHSIEILKKQLSSTPVIGELTYYF